MSKPLPLLPFVLSGIVSVVTLGAADARAEPGQCPQPAVEPALEVPATSLVPATMLQLPRLRATAVAAPGRCQVVDTQDGPALRCAPPTVLAPMVRMPGSEATEVAVEAGEMVGVEG